MTDFVVRRWELAPYPGDQAPPHVHRESDEGFCVLNGRLEVLVGADRRVLEAGEFVVVPAGTTHTFATVGDSPASVLAIMTPEVDALVESLHAADSDGERSGLWARYRSAIVDGSN